MRDKHKPRTPLLFPSTSMTVADHPLGWFMLMSLVFGTPVWTVLFFRQQLVFVMHSICDSGVHSTAAIAFSTVLLVAYASALLLSYGSLMFPTYLRLQALFPGTRFRCRRMHVSHMSPRRMDAILEHGVFTIFVKGVSSGTVPLLVTGNTTGGGILHSLSRMGFLPEATSDSAVRLYMCDRPWHRIKCDTVVSELGLGALSHVEVRVPMLGGTSNSRGSLPCTPSRSHASQSTSPDSPSKHTRSKTRATADNSDDDDDTPVLISPPKKRKVERATKNGEPDINAMSDIDVWDMDNKVIIDAARKSWSSEAYNHYTVKLRRKVKPDGSPLAMYFVFTCRVDPKGHKPAERARAHSSHGTSNLHRANKQCDERRGVKKGSDTAIGAQQDLFQSVSKYTPARHRALIAMRCARSSRPFNIVKDPDYRAEVELLRPGTKIPSPQTVSSDIRKIYQKGAQFVKEYFARTPGAIHLVVDGWTSPLVSSYLGIVVVWYASGKIWRSILEFVRLKESHTGVYLAQVMKDCLQRFGLLEKLYSICMDNASNCDSSVVALAELIPTFRGALARSRCIPHTAFISFFFRPAAKKKAPMVKVAPSKRKRNATGHGAFGSVAQREDERDLASARSAELLVMLGAELEEGDEEGEEDPEGLVDEGKAAHDREAVSSVHKNAIAEAKALAIDLSERERAMALGLFPKVAGLARRVHDSPTLQEKFEKLVEANPKYIGQKKALERRVPTRWNSDFACLRSHCYFETAVRQLTSDAENGLSAFVLEAGQWELAKQLTEVLELFSHITELFFQAEVPLIHDVIPLLEAMEHDLTKVRDAAELPNVIRIAAIAALLVIAKYYALTDDNEVYRIAVVMCPDRKLDWFDKNPDWRAADRAEVRQVLNARWLSMYGDEPSTTTPAPLAATKRSKWASSFESFVGNSSSEPSSDTLEAYLTAPLVSGEEIQRSGGRLAYWEQSLKTRPRLTRFALDHLSAPASFVDAERAFSNGRVQVNHLQHNTGSQTFKSRVAVGSWSGTPLLPDDKPAEILSKVISVDRKKSSKGKERAQHSEVDTEPESMIC